MTSLTHEQLGEALHVLHHLVWPDNEPWNTHWSHSAYDDNVPFFGFAAEEYYTKQYPDSAQISQYGRHSLVELRVMMRDLEDLYKENRASYGTADIEPHAKTLAGVQQMLCKTIGDFHIGCVHQRERPLSVMEVTKRSYMPLKGNHRAYAGFDKLIATAEAAIARNPRAPAHSFWAKDYEQSLKGVSR